MTRAILTAAAVLLLLLAHSAGAQALMPTRAPDAYRFDRAQHGLCGPVRSTREEAFSLDNHGRKWLIGNHTLHFDERGRVTRALRGNDQVEDLFGETYTYREDGRIAEKLYHNSGRRGGREVYVYDDARRTVEISLYAYDGPVGMREVRFYDAGGLELRRETLTEDSDAPGRAPKPTGTITFAYDAKGAHVVATATVPDMKGYSYRLARMRDAAGGRTVTVVRLIDRDPVGGGDKEPPNPAAARMVYKFDQFDQPLAVESYDAGGRLLERTTYTRKLDAHGNWTEESVQTRGPGPAGLPPKQTVLRTRKLSYY